MPTYVYRCPGGHDIEHVQSFSEEKRELIACDIHGCDAEYIFVPPHPSNVRIPPNFRAVLGAPTWSDVFDVSEKELAKMPNVEKASVVASQPGVGNTISQPGPELKRKLKEVRSGRTSDSV